MEKSHYAQISEDITELPAESNEESVKEDNEVEICEVVSNEEEKEEQQPKTRLSKRFLSNSTTEATPAKKLRPANEQEPLRLKLKISKGVATKIDFSESEDERRIKKIDKDEEDDLLIKKKKSRKKDDEDDGWESEEDKERRRRSKKKEEDDEDEDNKRKLRKRGEDGEGEEGGDDKKAVLRKKVACGPKDGDELFCWTCHKPNSTQGCSKCLRDYHFKCVQLSEEHPDWICPECSHIMEVEARGCGDLTPDRLNTLLGFTLKRMKGLPEAKEFFHDVDPEEEPSYHKFVKNPTSLKKLKKNIDMVSYRSTAAFLSDVKWLLHNSIVFNSTSSRITSMARFLVKVCRQELAEIENCSDCYHNAHTKSDWFLHVCRKPHLLVWARLKGYPFWPAKVVAVNQKSQTVDARFFGEHDKAWVPVKECFLLSVDQPPSGAKKRSGDLSIAFGEMKRHIARISKKYGKFVYAPQQTALDPNRLDEQLKSMVPGWSESLASTNNQSCSSPSVVMENVIEQNEATLSPEEEVIRNLELLKTSTCDALNEVNDEASTDGDDLQGPKGATIPEHNYSITKENEQQEEETQAEEEVTSNTGNDPPNGISSGIEKKGEEEPSSTTPDTTTTINGENSQKVDFSLVQVKQENFDQYLKEETTQDRKKPEEKEKEKKKGAIKVRRDVFSAQKPMLTIVDIDQMRPKMGHVGKTYLERKKKFLPKRKARDMRLSDEVSLMVVEGENSDTGTPSPSISPKPVEVAKKPDSADCSAITITTTSSNATNKVAKTKEAPKKTVGVKKKDIPKTRNGESDEVVAVSASSKSQPPSLNGPLILSNAGHAFLAANQPPNLALTQNNLGQLSLVHLTNLTCGIQTNFANLTNETIGYNNGTAIGTIYATACPPLISSIVTTATSTISSTTSSNSASSSTSAPKSLPPALKEPPTVKKVGGISVRTLSSLRVNSSPPPGQAQVVLPPPPLLATPSGRKADESEEIASELNRHTERITEVVRKSLESMLSDMGNRGVLQARIRTLQLEKERLILAHQKSISELKQKHESSLRELRAQLESEKQKALKELSILSEKTLAEAKKKQWCAQCGKEALFYCCWNTSYCNYPCQQQHWPIHMTSCGQLGNNGQRDEDEPVDEPVSAVAAKRPGPNKFNAPTSYLISPINKQFTNKLKGKRSESHNTVNSLVIKSQYYNVT